MAWLLATVTPDFVRDLLPETRDLEVEVHALPNLGGVNVVVHGLLGRGVAASTRFDPQAKGLGEWARSRHVDIPEVLSVSPLRAMAGEFVRREVAPYLQDWEDAGEVPRSLHLAAAKQGLLGVSFPESVGGEGGDLLDSIAVQEAMFEAGASSGLMAALFTGGIALPHIAAIGDPDLVDRFVRPTLAGEKIGALAVTEPDGGSDVAAIRTTARRDGDEYVVDGTKTFITSGVRADFVTVAVRTGVPAPRGISLLVVEKGTAGFTVDRPGEDGLALLGHRRAGVRVVPGARGQPGRGRELRVRPDRRAVRGRADRAGRARLRHRGPVAGPRRGVRAGARDVRPSAVARQVVRHRLVEMHRQVDVARTYTRAVAAGHVAGEDVVAEACLAKQTAVETAVACATRRCSCTAAPATSTAPRSSGTTATRGSCPSAAAPPRCSPTWPPGCWGTRHERRG